MNSHCENLWTDNSGNGLGRHTKEEYRVAVDDGEK